MNYLEKLDTQTRIKLGLIVLLSLFAFSLLSSTKATPASIFFPIKRMQEKIFYKFKPNVPARVEYLSFLLDQRLEELNGLVKDHNYSYVLSSSLRYSATAGEITQMVIDNKLSDKPKDLVNKFIAHQKSLEKLLDKFPPDDTEWKYIQDDINYLAIYIKQLSRGDVAVN